MRALDRAKGAGVESFATDYLIAYVKETFKELEALPDEPTPADLERYKANLQGWLEAFKNVSTQNIEMFKSLITAGQNALRTSLLINGGASVAMLTFIGSLATSLATSPGRPPLMDPKLLATPLVIFVIGTLLGAVASGGTYLVQLFYYQRRVRSADCLNLLVILLGFAAYVLFACGVWKAYGVFAT